MDNKYESPKISFPSQKWSHIEGEVDDALLCLDIFCMQDIRRGQVGTIFLDALPEGCKRVVRTALDFMLCREVTFPIKMIIDLNSPL